jgi:hypothetical protein
MANYSIWQSVVPPSAGVTQTVGDTDAISVGTVFSVTEAVTATHVRFYFGAGWDTLGKPSTVAIYNNSSGALLQSASYSGTPSSGWNDVAITNQALTNGVGYIAVVYYAAGRYPAEGSYFDDHNPSNGVLTLTVGGSNGKYGYATGISRPTNSFNFSSYFPDVIVATASATVFERSTALAGSSLLAVRGERHVTRQVAITGNATIATTGQFWTTFERSVAISATPLLTVGVGNVGWLEGGLRVSTIE